MTERPPSPTLPSAPAPTPPPGCPAHAGGHVPLYGQDFADDPAAVYARLRGHGAVAPVLLHESVTASLVTSYEAALQVLRTPGAFSKDPRRWAGVLDGRVGPDNPLLPMMGYRPNALFTDGEEHARFRSAITDSLERIDPIELREYVERGADRLIDTFGPAGRADLRREYALVVPLLVFMEMFGCPPATAEKLVRGMSGIFDVVDAEKANATLLEGMVELVASKRAKPGADVTSWLMAHPSNLSDEEMVHQLVLLMGAGTEPQQNLISNGLRLLLSDDRFAGSLSGGSLPIEDALDEVLWTDPPMANYGVHFPVRDVEVAGVRLPAGEPVVVSFAAANTDPALDTEHRTGNRAHLAWSAGPHTCPAKEGARLIASVAIERLLDRIPDLELAIPAERLRWRPGPFHRALAELPVVFAPVRPEPSAHRPPLSDRSPRISGDDSWQNSPAAPTSSTLPVPTSTERTPPSAPAGRRRWWSFLVGSRRGR